MKYYNEIADEPIDCLWDLDDEYSDAIFEITFPNAALGGYPIFTQQDPREYSGLKEFDTLLFELDTVYDREKGLEIMWGDCGTGTFFIPREALKALDFSRVLYNYDCC